MGTGRAFACTFCIVITRHAVLKLDWVHVKLSHLLLTWWYLACSALNVHLDSLMLRQFQTKWGNAIKKQATQSRTHPLKLLPYFHTKILEVHKSTISFLTFYNSSVCKLLWEVLWPESRCFRLHIYPLIMLTFEAWTVLVKINQCQHFNIYIITKEV